MTQIDNAWLEHQQQRWLRPDAHRWLRHDHERFDCPRSPEWKIHAQRAVERRQDDPGLHDPRSFASQILALKWNLAALRLQHAMLRHELSLRRKAGFDPGQPRVPAGNPGGGQWTSGGKLVGIARDAPIIREGGELSDSSIGGESLIHLAQHDGIFETDGTPYYKPGGHHEMPKGIYTKWNLSPDTRRVFERATTGTVPKIFLRTTPDGVPQGHFWNGSGGAHRLYNQAAHELGNQFLERNKIFPEQMTPDHARTLLKEIRESQDPRIRNYNNMIRLIRRIFPLRSGRGVE